MNKTARLENERFTALVTLEGAQLCSLYDKATQQELIWQRDPEYWAESAPLLFPVVGNLQGNEYRYKGKRYHMPKHGIVRYADYEVQDLSATQLTLSTSFTEATLDYYPFKFRLAVTFSLTSEGITVCVVVDNIDDHAIPISMGFHPAVALDIKNYSLPDYEIIFSENEQLDLYGVRSGVLSCIAPNYLDCENRIPLSKTVFKDDALIFKNIKSTSIGVLRPLDNWQVTVSAGDAPHLGIWSPPAAPFVCIEPWHILPGDDQQEGEITIKDMINLPPKEQKSYEISIILESVL